MRILITGGAGFIGSSLAEYIARQKEAEVVLVDNLSTGHVHNLPLSRGTVRFIKCDVNNYADISSVMLAGNFDYVFHYAAVVGVKRTLDNPVKVLEDIKGIENILMLSKNSGVKRIFYASSSEVYGEPVHMPQHEHTTPLNSRLPYAIVKNLGEAYCRSYYQEFGLPYTLFRFFNTYGPKQSKDFVISRFLKAALAGDDITIYGDGKQSRTFCYVEDNIEASYNALIKEMYINDVVNIGNDVEVSVEELAKLIVKLTGSKSKLVYLPALEEGDMTRRQPDIGKMKQLLSKELTSLETGLKRVVEAWKGKN